MMRVLSGVAVANLPSMGRMAPFPVAAMPYSNTRFTVAMPDENTENLCRVLPIVFERMGGLPSILTVDNAVRCLHHGLMVPRSAAESFE